MRKYTILHTIETGGPGGAETVLLNFVANLDPSRYRSLVLLPEGSWLPRKLRELNVPTVIAESKAWYDPSLLRTMGRLVRQEGVDLIHSHLPDQNFYSCVVGRLTGCKTIVTYHGAPPLSHARTLRESVKLWWVRHTAAVVVVVSEYLEQLFQELGFPREKIVRIYNGVDLEKFAGARSGGLRAELGCPEGTRLVGMVANLRGPKGYEYFVQAARRVVDSMPQTRFVAVGDIDRQILMRLSDLVDKLDLRDRFVFVGFREDVPAILRDVDVFVLSSISEGFSLATVEAMAAGKPVVVTRCGGPEEVIDDGRTGFLVPPADPEALASRICELLADPERAAILGQNARAKVSSAFSMERMVHQYERLYERLLNAR
jgi:glycosyltransferase involved in cell wall biosynthesis